MIHWGKIVAALAAPLLLAACVLTPGKFTSTLTVNKDRSFAYTYVGEVIAFDFGKEFAEGMKSGLEQKDAAATPTHAGFAPDEDKPDDDKLGDDKPDDAATAAKKKAEFDAKCRAIAAALTREAGYRKAEYVGDGKFLIDYAITGKLTHNFIYPFNIDAEAVFPFIALELRADGKVRMKAPAFAKEGAGTTGTGGLGGMGDMGPASRLDGTFTLDTDAEIVSQNEENGVTTLAGRKRVVWTVTPLNRTAPMAVLGF